MDLEAMDDVIMEDIVRADLQGEELDGVAPILDPLQYLPVWVDLIRAMI